VALVVLAVADLVVRWRRSGGVERLQMRWFVFGLVVFSILLTTAIAVEAAGIRGMANELAWDLGAWVLGLGSLPVTIGIAITRYRLYDIDRIISRTITYSIVVGLLGLGAAGVAALAGSQFDTPLVVAATTLAVAALFNPVRRRVQRVVDRRFNRSKYDAESVVDEFAGSLQDRVDPDVVIEGWVGVVAETMQPSSVGVWLRADE
jgi:hypothetical protein